MSGLDYHDFIGECCLLHLRSESKNLISFGFKLQGETVTVIIDQSPLFFPD